MPLPLRPLWLRAQPWVPVIAMLACLPALANGLELDDLYHAARADDPADFIASAFTFFGEGPRAPHVPPTDLPWWTEPGLRLDLLRPVAALTHLLDYTAWPGLPWLMHLHSILWYGLLVFLLQRLLGALTGDRSRAALGALVFGLAQAHAMDVGWLSARNVVIAGVLVTGALHLHHRFRRDGSTLAAVAAPLLFGLALLANEGAVSAAGYLLAYAIVLDTGRRRLLSLVPYAAVAIAWRVAYELLGYGADGSGMYLDPTTDSAAYAARTVTQAAPMLAARLGLAVIDPLASVPGADLVAFVTAVPFVGGLWWLAREPLRSDPVLRLWGLGMLLSCFTAGTSVPTDRGLLLLGLGGAPFVADLVLWLRRADATRFQRTVAGVLVALHLVISPLLLPLRVRTSAWVHALAERVADTLPNGPEVAEQTLVLLHAPSDLVMIYGRTLAEHRGQGEGFPRRIRWLYTGSSPVAVIGLGPDAFELRTERPWLAAPLDRMFRGDLRFHVGQRFTTPCITAEVAAVERPSPDVALPTAVRFGLHRERAECSIAVMAWSAEGFVPFALPERGAMVELEPAVLF